MPSFNSRDVFLFLDFSGKRQTKTRQVIGFPAIPTKKSLIIDFYY